MFNRNPMYQPFAGLYKNTIRTGINWGNLLNNTQKTLSIINQAIPIFYQVKPIWNNAKTMFRVMGEMGKLNENYSNNTPSSGSNTVAKPEEVQNNTNQPNFFI